MLEKRVLAQVACESESLETQFFASVTELQKHTCVLYFGASLCCAITCGH